LGGEDDRELLAFQLWRDFEFRDLDGFGAADVTAHAQKAGLGRLRGPACQPATIKRGVFGADRQVELQVFNHLTQYQARAQNFHFGGGGRLGVEQLTGLPQAAAALAAFDLNERVGRKNGRAQVGIQAANDDGNSRDHRNEPAVVNDDVDQVEQVDVVRASARLRHDLGGG